MSLRQVRGGVLAQRSAPVGDTLALLQPTLAAHQVAPHRHDEAHCVLVLRGRYEHGARGEAGAGPLLIVNPPRTEHEDRFAAGERLAQARFLCLQISAATWWRWQQQADLPSRPLALGGATQAAAGWLQALQGAATGDALDPLALDELFADSFAHAPAERAPYWLLQARRLLREHSLDAPPRSLSLTDCAARLRVHPVTLTRAFRRRWGLSPSAYVQALRLDRAAARLRERPRLSVAEVAADCGFHDQAHLTRQFRAAYGLPPQRWREA